jgi:thiol-disulfide isomerase/thioredoxin
MPREAPDDEEGGGSSQSTSHPLVGKPAPNFKHKNLAGETVQLEKLKGKVIVLDFWATWCGPCMQTMPLLDQMMAEFDSSKVQLYAVNIQEAKNRINLALSRLKIDPEVLLDEEGEVGNAYQANAIPQTVIIDAEGNVVKVFVGGGAGVVNQIRNALVDHLETSKN